MAPQSPQFDTVVFDLGNVMVGWDPYLPLADRLSRSEWQEFAEASGFGELNVLADRGVPISEVTRIATEKNPEHGKLVARYYERFEQSLKGPVPGVAAIVEELQVEGLRLFGLTNWSAETFHFAEASAPAIGQLEAVMVSGSEGVAKPDPQLFQRLVEAHDLVVERTIFIDDSEHNVRAAAELGFTAIRFTETDDLRNDLHRMGVLP